MDLIEVDVVGAQTAERRVHRVQDVLAGETAVVGTVSHGEVDLGRDDDLVAAGKLTQGATDDLLADAREYMSAVSKKLMPTSSARSKNGRLSASGSTHSRQSVVPKVIAPKQIRETRRPVRPSVT